MLKIVIDTNVLIDGSSDYYHFANRIIDEVLAGQIEAYANQATIRENQFLTSQKISDEGYTKKLEYFFKTVKPITTVKRLNIVEDHDDNKILESAASCSADFLITSDRHLLKLEKYENTKIVTPAGFWAEYEDQDLGWRKWLSLWYNT